MLHLTTWSDLTTISVSDNWPSMPSAIFGSILRAHNLPIVGGDIR
jgi:hypothetical protein